MFFNTQPYNSFVKKMLIFSSGILKVICIHSHLANGQGFSSKGKNKIDQFTIIIYFSFVR